MKLFMTTCMLLGASSILSAQSRLGFKAGLNLASEFSIIDKESAMTKTAPSFHLTTYYDGRVSSGFSIQPGISLQGKGAKSEYLDETYTERLLYIEVPVNFLGRVHAGRGELFFGGGPYVAYGIDAKLKSRNTKTKLYWGDGAEEINPIDAGLSVLVGYRFQDGLTLSFGSSAGFLNLSNLPNSTYQNRVSSLSVGFEL